MTTTEFLDKKEEGNGQLEYAIYTLNHIIQALQTVGNITLANSLERVMNHIGEGQNLLNESFNLLFNDACHQAAVAPFNILNAALAGIIVARDDPETRVEQPYSPGPTQDVLEELYAHERHCRCPHCESEPDNFTGEIGDV